MTSRIIDLGFVGDIARCPKCGSRVDGEFSKYVAGSPGLNEYRSDCPKCGTKLRFRGDNWFVGYPDFQWVSPNGKWAVMGLFDGPVLDFDDAVARIELASPEGDNAVPIVILRDGSIVWGYDEDYRRSDYPENVARECERRLRSRYAELVNIPSKGTATRSVRSKPKSNSGTNNVHGKPGESTQQTPTGFNRDSIVSKSEGLNIADSGKTDETSANRNWSKRRETSKDSSKRMKSGSDSKSSSTRTKTKTKTKPTKGAR